MSGLAEYALPYTYSGLLDDVLARYPVVEGIDDEFFGRAIAKNIFFSGGIFLNDGYLVNHAAARKGLFDEKSILRVMMRENFVRILSREATPEGLASMPERMAASGNDSFAALTKSAEWDDLSGILKRISPLLFSRGNIMRWPNRDMSVGFTRLMDGALAKEGALTHLAAGGALAPNELREAFLGAEPEKGNPRTKFESVAGRIVRRRCPGAETSALTELMTLANQCYHYNFGICLKAELQQEVTVDTVIGPSFQHLLRFDTADAYVVDQIPMIPIPKWVAALPGKAFHELLDTTTNVGQAKLAYLKAVESVFCAAPGTERFAILAVRGAAEEYKARLAEHFSDNVASSAGAFWGDIALNVVTGSLSAVFKLNNLIGTVVSIACGGAAARPREFLIRCIRTKLFERQFDDEAHSPVSKRVYRFKAAELMPVFSSVEFDPQVAQTVTAAIPKLVS